MGSPLSPVIANFYMEHFEKKAISSAEHKPSVWYRYVDDTFVVWKRGEEKLKLFLEHLNSQHPNIKFTMELEENNQLAFLDVLVMRQQGRLNHKVYRKPTHTDRYLHKLSNHHPTQKAGIIKTLSERAKRICAPAYLEEEQEHLEQVLMGNGYSKNDIRRAMNPKRRPKAEEQPTQKAARKYLSPSNLLTLYKAQIRPSLEYCSHIWGAAASTTLSILDAVQRKAIRLIGDPALTCHLQPLSHRRAVGDLSLFYRYSNGFCSSELYNSAALRAS
nr:unnamed protein product [Callosobruchus chinensis]